MFKRKATLIAENAKLEAKVELLEAENKRLQGQTDNLQLALLSKISPQVYNDIVASKVKDEEISNIQSDPMQEALGQLREQQESPLFSGPEDFMKTFFPDGKLSNALEELATGAPQITPIHENGES